MPRNEQEESLGSTSTTPSTTVRLRVRSDPFLLVCRGFSVITSLTAILCIVVNVLSAIRSFEDGSDIFDGIFRCYAVAIAFFVVLAETEWGFILKFSKVLEYWVGRGMLQILYVFNFVINLVLSTCISSLLIASNSQTQLNVAVMTRAFPDYTGVQKELVLLQNISSYMLLACGVVYLVSGLLCIGHLKRFRQKQEVTRDQAVKDLEELEKRREELEQLLVAEAERV